MNTSTAAVTAVLDRLTAAWNAGDGAAYGAEFTADATYITYVGTLYVGGAEIGAAHQALFESFLKGTRLTSEIVDVRFTGPDTAVVITRGDVHKGRPGRLHKIQTYTLVRQESGDWKVAAFQNTKHKALMEAISFKVQPATRPAA
ncbi:SgcJ/EcaC family oxidoreductase [Actinoallomurus spadix]|uniref:SgcJ/EcaC family oxidoreductase n=1 Tax=Actinoallomurus spadix TaxID=79912 RepID=A0ABP3G038_9ACTN|nr:SgcJ/EcaC family oxidoreductase [Actinoallomurus spadix]MCO5989262.1 SgcJ/EcaC family oxidoreductase [Actinoallomurus spadix]